MINYTDSQLSAIFDKETIAYLQKKNTGGGSNEKGTIFENDFAVYNIAIFAKSVIENGKDVNIYSQIKSFVDDLIIEIDGGDKFRHYQLKNKKNVSWGKDLKSISDDCYKQKILNESLGKGTKIGLIVSAKIRRDSLNKLIPVSIKSFSKARYFPYSNKLMKVVNQIPLFRNALIYLTAFENPEPDKIEYVAKVMLAVWCDRGDDVSVRKLLENSQKLNPSYIRSFVPCPDIDPDVSIILEQIKGFSYKISKGFFHWNYGQTDSGTLPFSMCSEQFNKFQERVKKANPTSFEELEVNL